jgi:hypothetical protein
MTQHLKSRRYDPERYLTQWVGETDLTVPLFDFAGRMRGTQVYTPSFPKHHDNPKLARYFTRCFSLTQCLWGTELPVQGKTVFLTESVFKSAALHQLGLDSWSLNGSTVQDKLYHQLTLLPYRLVCVGDDDPAGREFADTFKHGAVMNDLDERTPQELKDLLDCFL